MATTLTYFSLLGISEDAGREELEARYQVLADYLTSPSIPPALREWANRQAALVDEAYAVLADPERRAAAREQQLPGETPHPESAALMPDADRPRAGRQPDALEARRTERRHAGAGREPAARPEPAGPGPFDRLLKLRPSLLALGVFLGLVVLGAILFTLYGLPGQGGSEEKPSAAQDSLIPLDNERVAELMAAVQQDPENPEVLFELGETFFQANEWQAAIDWFTRLLAVDPNNAHANTDIGTAHFNLGRPEEAKAAWLAVLDIAPNDVQVHYNLGFLYANAEPQDLAAARREWQTVLELAPGSELAGTAQVHLNGLLEGAPADAAAGTTPSSP